MPAGRPLKFASAEEMQVKIDAYFREREAEEKPISITGLANYLDTYRDLLCNYAEKDEFHDTIKKAKQRVEQFYEERLIYQNAAGPIFALKNFDWKDSQSLEVENKDPLKGRTLEDLLELEQSIIARTAGRRESSLDSDSKD